ncbi:MAG: hypothetical protein NE330_04455 [Lentisphaeraceae bacterium]|nr:hypothetical protein [Lentisphaeraceae bacterium]
MALSLLFHLLLFTVANKLPAFQNTKTPYVPPKKKALTLRSISESEILKKQTTKTKSDLSLKRNSQRLSASLKAHISKEIKTLVKPKDINLNNEKTLGQKTGIDSIKAPVKELPPNFYHINVKSPIKTQEAPKAKLGTPSGSLTIKQPARSIISQSNTGTPTDLSNQIAGQPRVSLRRSIPRISPPKINFEKKTTTQSGRDIKSPLSGQSSLKAPKAEPAQMENFLTITPYTYIDTIDQIGYFKLDLQVNHNANGMHPIDKDIFFIIDSSRSISRKKLTEFVRGTLNSFSTLSANDRFNPVIFTVKATKGFDKFKEVSPESVKEARDFLSFFRILSGQTDVYNSIKPFVSDTVRENNRPIQIFLMTDGMSTVDDKKENPLLIKEITKDNNADISIFGFSCRENTNSFLMDFLAYRNRGDSLVLDQIENSNKDLTRYVSDRSEILVTDLMHRYSGSYPQDIFPKKLPHIYRNRTLSIYGTFNIYEESGLIQLLGRSSAGERQLIHKINFKKAKQGSSELAKNWAAQKIFHLIGQLTDNPSQEVLSEIYKLQQKFKVYIPYNLPKPQKALETPRDKRKGIKTQ